MDRSRETMPTGQRSASPEPEGTTRHSDLPFSTVQSPVHLNSEEGRGTFPFPDALRTMDMDVDQDASLPSEATEDILREAKRARFRGTETMQALSSIEFIAKQFRDWLPTDPTVDLKREIARKLHRGRCIAQAIAEQNQRAESSRMRLKKFFENALFDKNGEPRKTPYSRYLEDDSTSKPPPKDHATPNPKYAGHLSEIPSQALQEGPRPKDPPAECCMSDKFIEWLDRRAEHCFAKTKEPSREEIVANGFNFMIEEAFTAFRNYIAENELFEDDDFEFGEVSQHSFTVEYGKVYCHYNFTVEIKKNNEESWSSNHYFAEVERKALGKYYFCSPLEAADDGCCYLCKNQGISMLKHPSGGGYHEGHEGSSFCYPNMDSCSSDDDDECV